MTDLEAGSTLADAKRSPADTSALNPFDRNRVYFHLDCLKNFESIKSVKVEVQANHNTQTLTIPVMLLDKRDTTLHKLAARAMLDDLEHGRSYIHLGPNRPLPGSWQETSLVRKEAEGIACKWSLVSKWTSFFLAEEPYTPTGDDIFMDGVVEIKVSPGDDLLQPHGVVQHIASLELANPDAFATDDFDSTHRVRSHTRTVIEHPSVLSHKRSRRSERVTDSTSPRAPTHPIQFHSYEGVRRSAEPNSELANSLAMRGSRNRARGDDEDDALRERLRQRFDSSTEVIMSRDESNVPSSRSNHDTNPEQKLNISTPMGSSIKDQSTYPRYRIEGLDCELDFAGIPPNMMSGCPPPPEGLPEFDFDDFNWPSDAVNSTQLLTTAETVTQCSTPEPPILAREASSSQQEPQSMPPPPRVVPLTDQFRRVYSARPQGWSAPDPVPVPENQSAFPPSPNYASGVEFERMGKRGVSDVGSEKADATTYARGASNAFSALERLDPVATEHRPVRSHSRSHSFPAPYAPAQETNQTQQHAQPIRPQQQPTPFDERSAYPAVLYHNLLDLGYDDGATTPAPAPASAPQDNQDQPASDRAFVASLLSFQHYDGSVDFGSWEVAEQVLGKAIADALWPLQLAWPALGDRELWTAAVHVLLEQHFQACRALWELMAIKAASYCRSHALFSGVGGELGLLEVVGKGLEGLELPFRRELQEQQQWEEERAVDDVVPEIVTVEPPVHERIPEKSPKERAKKDRKKRKAEKEEQGGKGANSKAKSPSTSGFSGRFFGPLKPEVEESSRRGTKSRRESSTAGKAKRVSVPVPVPIAETGAEGDASRERVETGPADAAFQPQRTLRF